MLKAAILPVHTFMQGLLISTGLFSSFYNLDFAPGREEAYVNYAFMLTALLSAGLAWWCGRCAGSSRDHRADPESETPARTAPVLYWVLPAAGLLLWRLYTLHNMPQLFPQATALHLIACISAGFLDVSKNLPQAVPRQKTQLLLKWVYVSSPILFPISWASSAGYALLGFYLYACGSRIPALKKMCLFLFGASLLLSLVLIPAGYSWSASRLIDALHRVSLRGALYVVAIFSAGIHVVRHQRPIPLFSARFSVPSHRILFVLSLLTLSGMRGSPGVLGAVLSLWIALTVLSACLDILFSPDNPIPLTGWSRAYLALFLCCGLVSSSFHGARPTQQLPFTERKAT